jgi:uncharacterized membrane protein YphA (DoxX/SURF4 family)
MEEIAFIILRIGLGITFVWMSILIFKDPMRFGKLIKPWAVNLTPMPIPQAMILTGIFDLIVGIWLISGYFPFYAAIIAALHLVQVLLATAAAHGTFRDVGLLANAIALVVYYGKF